MLKNLRWRLAQFFEMRWWKNYLKNKKNDYLEYKKNYWENFLQNIENFKLRENEQILDIGCGPAGIYMVLPNNNIDAIDPLCESYHNKLSHFSFSFYPNVRFFNISFENFSATKTYDKIFCLNAINHFLDLEKSIKKIADLLHPQAKLYVSIDVHNYKFLCKLFKIIPVDVLHPHQFTLLQYQNMLQKFQLKILQTTLIKKRSIFDYYLIVLMKT